MAAKLEKTLARVRRRWSAAVLVECMAWTLLAAGGLAALAVLAERVVAVKVLMGWSAGALLALAGAVGLVLWWHRRPGVMATAIHIDRRLCMKERFSTAVSLAGSDEPFAIAAVAEAHAAAAGADAGKGLVAWPVRPLVHAGAVWALAGAFSLFVPSMDVMGLLARRRDEENKAARIEEAKIAVTQTVGAVKMRIDQLGDPALAKELADLSRAANVQTPQALKREAIRKLGDLSERIKELRSGPREGAAEAMKKMLKRIHGTPDGLSRELSRALAQGDFERAAELLRDFQDKISKGELSAEDSKALAGQMGDLSAQLKELVEKDSEFADELEKAGLDGKMAALDEESLREALKKRGLSDEKIDELLEKAAACSKASEMCERLAEAMSRCQGEGTGAGVMSADEMAELIEQLDELEGIEQDMALTEASLDEIARAIAELGEGQDGEWLSLIQGRGKFVRGVSIRRRPGAGGAGAGKPGRGSGPRATDNSGKTGTRKTRVKNPSGKKGPVIAGWYFKGDQVKGQSKRELKQVVQAARDRAADAISDSRIPKQYANAVKKYFGGLEKMGDKPE